MEDRWRHWQRERRHPDFELKTLDGKRFSLGEAWLTARSCWHFSRCRARPASTPSFSRAALQGVRRKSGVTLVGISQNDAKETAAFNKEFGVTFPVLLDDTSSYPVSNAYGLTNVPTIFWIAQDGEIEVSSVGWVKADFEQINRKMAEPRKGRAGPGVQARRRCARFPRGLRVEELGAGPAPLHQNKLGQLTTKGTEATRGDYAFGHVLLGASSGGGCTLVHCSPCSSHTTEPRTVHYNSCRLSRKSLLLARCFVGGDT